MLGHIADGEPTLICYWFRNFIIRPIQKSTIKKCWSRVEGRGLRVEGRGGRRGRWGFPRYPTAGGRTLDLRIPNEALHQSSTRHTHGSWMQYKQSSSPAQTTCDLTSHVTRKLSGILPL